MQGSSAKDMDVLLEALRLAGMGVPAENPGLKGYHGKNLRLYDFRSPDKFSKDQLRTLLLLHENFGRALTTSLSAFLRTTVQVTPTLAEQSPYGQFVRGLHDPTVLGILTIDPLPGNALMEIDPKVIFPIIDRLLGGPGHGTVSGRGLTDIEASVVRRVFNTILEAMVEAWRNVADVRPRLEALETSPLFAQLVAPTEMVAYLVFSLKLASQSGEMKICLPYMLLEPVLPMLSARNWMIKDPRRQTAPETERLAKELAEVSLPVSVELGRATITIGEMLDLEVGDIIELDAAAGSPADILVKGRRKFRGKVGRVGRHLAVQVVDVIGEGESGCE